jgi:ankyrin repeat protein
MDKKNTIYLRGRNRNAIKNGNLLDVTKMTSNGRGTKIIKESDLTSKYIKSNVYFIVSRNKANLTKAEKILNNKSVKIKSPLLKKSTKITGNKNSKDIVLASENGHLDMVKYLSTLDSVDPEDNQNEAIIIASRNGHLNVVKFLASLKSVNPGDGDNEAIITASDHGHLNVVKFLASLDSVDPGARDNLPIMIASDSGHLDIVEFLASLDSVDPGAHNNEAIVVASYHGYLEIIKFLSSLYSVNPSRDPNFVDDYI